MISNVSEFIDNFFEKKNGEIKFTRKLVNKEFAIKLGLVLIVVLNLGIGIFLECISSLGGFLYGKSFNILNLINPVVVVFRLFKFFPIYLILNILMIGVYIKFMINIRASFKEFDEGQKGSSRFATRAEIDQQYRAVPIKTEFYNGSGGVPIARGYKEYINNGQKIKKEVMYIDDSAVNNLIIGTTRSGKGEMFVVPTIDIYSRASKKASLIINDPKGELIAMSRETLENRGYEVLMLNILEPLNSMSFNPLQLIKEAYKKKNYSEAQLLCNTLTHSLYYNPNAKDPFWENSAKSLVNALILAICDECIKSGEEDKITMYTVANMLSELGGSNKFVEGKEVNKLDEYFKKLPKDSVAKSQYATSSFAGGNTRGGIFSMAMSKLQNFTFEEIAKMTSKNSLDLEDIGFSKTNNSKPKAIFMVTPDFDTSNYVLVSIFIRQIYYVLSKQSSLSRTGKCDREVIFLVDEFGNLPSIESMSNIVTVCLGRGIRFNLIIQDLAQLDKLYGEDAKTIIGNCGNKIYILSNDNETAESISKSLGNQTIVTTSRSGEIFSLNKSHTESLESRELIKAEELKMREGETLVIRVIKRRDNQGNKITPYPIFNKGEYAMKYRYEYLSEDFDNVRNVFGDVLVNSLHKDVKLSDLIIDFDTKNVMDKLKNEKINTVKCETNKINDRNKTNDLDKVDDIDNNVYQVEINTENIKDISDNSLYSNNKELLISLDKEGILTEEQKKIINTSINTIDALESYLKAINLENLYNSFIEFRG